MGNHEGVHIHQQAWFSLGNLDQDIALEYTLKGTGTGVYAFLLEGDVTINDIVLNRRDGLGISGTNRLKIKANLPSELLLMEVPL